MSKSTWDVEGRSIGMTAAKCGVTCGGRDWSASTSLRVVFTSNISSFLWFDANVPYIHVGEESRDREARQGIGVRLTHWTRTTPQDGRVHHTRIRIRQTGRGRLVTTSNTCTCKVWPERGGNDAHEILGPSASRLLSHMPMLHSESTSGD